MLGLGNQAFFRLFTHPSFTYSSVGMLCCLFPLTVTWARDNVSRDSAQPSPSMTCRNLRIPLLSLQLWPCTVIPQFWYGPVQGCTVPFWVIGTLLSWTTGAAEPAPLEGGVAGTPHSRSTALGVSGREAISQPVFMCSDTTRARLFHLSSFPLSQWRVQCLLASPRCHRQTLPGKNNPVLLQTSTSRSLAQPPWVTEPLPVLEPAGPGSTGMGPVCSTGSEPRLAPSATPPRAGGAGTGTAWPWPSHCFPCWMLNWPRARARWWKPAGT